MQLIGPAYDGITIEPIALAHYQNKVGDMVDIQYLGISLTKELVNQEENDVCWLPLSQLEEHTEIEPRITRIKRKAKKLVNQYQDKY